MKREWTLNKSLLRIIWFICVLLFACATKAEILLVLDTTSEIHQAVLQSIQTHIQSKNPGLQIIDQQEALGVVAETRLRRGNESPVDLVVTIGSRALQKVLETSVEEPVLSVLVPRQTYDSLMNMPLMIDRSAITSAVYIDQPIERQFALARMILPRSVTAGLLLGPGSQHKADSLRRSAAVFGFKLNLVELDADTDAARGIKRVLQGSDLIIAVHDPLIIKPVTAKWLLYMAYQRKKPVIAFSRAYLKAGAVAAVYSSPEDIGQQAAVEIDLRLQSSTLRLRETAYPATYTFDFNRSVAESLELTIPQPEQALEKLQALLEGQR